MVHELQVIDHHANVRGVAADVEQNHCSSLRRVDALGMLGQVAAKRLGVLCLRVGIPGQRETAIAQNVSHEVEARHWA